MIRILKALYESIDLGIYSYVKPGAPHRFSTHFTNLHEFVRSFTESLNTYVKAIDTGFSVAEGRLGLNRANVGTLISEAISSSSRALGFKGFPELHLILIPTTIASSYAIKLGGNRELIFKRIIQGIKDLLYYTEPKEVVKVYQSLRHHGGRYSEIISQVMLTPGRIESEALSLIDFYRELGSKDELLRFFSNRYSALITYALEYINRYLKTGDYNLAAINTYARIVQDMFNITLDLKMRSSSDLLNLLRKDKEFISSGMDFTKVIPILVASIFIGNLTL